VTSHSRTRIFVTSHSSTRTFVTSHSSRSFVTSYGSARISQPASSTTAGATRRMTTALRGGRKNPLMYDTDVNPVLRSMKYTWQQAVVNENKTCQRWGRKHSVKWANGMTTGAEVRVEVKQRTLSWSSAHSCSRLRRWEVELINWTQKKSKKEIQQHLTEKAKNSMRLEVPKYKKSTWCVWKLLLNIPTHKVPPQQPPPAKPRLATGVIHEQTVLWLEPNVIGVDVREDLCAASKVPAPVAWLLVPYNNCEKKSFP